MEKTIITTDSGMDTTNQEYMVGGVLNRSDGESYRDVLEISSKEILEQMKEGYTFLTSAPFIRDYEETFKRALKEGEHVVHLSMSSGISSTSVSLANMMAREINNELGEKRIHVIDSMNGATGGTLIGMYAQDLAKQGKSYQEIIDSISRLIKKVQTSFFVPNPTGFISSGRDKSQLCLKDKALLIGSEALRLAGVKYRVDFNDEGNLYTKQIIRGKASTQAMKMVQSIVNENTIQDYETNMAVIGTVLEDKVKMATLEDYLKQYFDRVQRQDINGVVAAYGSADLVGLSLVRKK